MKDPAGQQTDGVSIKNDYSDENLRHHYNEQVNKQQVTIQSPRSDRYGYVSVTGITQP